MLEREGHYYLGDIVNKFLPGERRCSIMSQMGADVFTKASLHLMMCRLTSQWYLDNCF